MKHNNMRDEDAKHAHDKKLSRNPVTIDSVPEDSYKARYEAAMGLLERALYIANDFSKVNRAAYLITQNIIRQKDGLRDSE